MKVMLIFPPDWFLSEPLSQSSVLTAVLRCRASGRSKDINLEMWDWYFSEDFLKKVLRSRSSSIVEEAGEEARVRGLGGLQLQLCEVEAANASMS